MLADAAEGGREAFDRVFDVCVVGSGPAGITVARRLADRGATVALMEGGGRERDDASQDLYSGESVGLEYFSLDGTRLRYFGGSSNHWGGWSRPLDPHDFEVRPGIPLSGWPIAKRDLDPYRAETNDILDLGPAGAYPDLPFEDPSYAFSKVQIRFSRPPTRFAEKYGAEIEASERILLALHANLVDIRLTDDLASVAELRFRSLAEGDPGFAVRARLYVLCLGGIENSRALLNAASQAETGIGNGHDLVGRHFSEHPHVVIADVLYEDPELDSAARRGFFSPSADFLAKNRCLNFNLRLFPKVIRAESPPPLGPAGRAVCSLPFAERLAWSVLGHGLDCGREPPPRDESTGTILITPEQALNPESRVRLGEERDPLGLRRIVLDWQLTELDYESMRIAALEFGGVLAKAGMARVRLRDWLTADDPRMPGRDAGPVAGHHHMCTTRMSDVPRTGVVDRDCRVHGLRDLYIGGSSVFATGGWANPTYTIVQLALRLGDHLSGRLGA
jgi:choline dehydrogenase-like flavoprotein